MSGLLISAGAFAAMAFPANPAGVTVYGAVNGPGFVALEGSKSLNSTVSQLGGFAADADRGSVLIRRSSGEAVTVDLGKLGTVPTVRPGDVVFVKSVDPSTHVFLEGGVARSGAIPFKPGMTLQEALQGTQGKIQTIRIHRQGPEGRVVTQTHDLLALNAPIVLQPADRVEVPYASAMQMSDRELLTILVIGLLILVIVS